MSKAPAEIKSLARAHTESAIRVLAGIMNETRAPPAARVAAAEALLDRGWGKPRQSHEVETRHRYVLEVPLLSLSSAEWEAEMLEPPTRSPAVDSEDMLLPLTRREA